MFFSNGSLAFESVSVCEGRGGGHSAEEGVSGSNSHLMQFRGGRRSRASLLLLFSPFLILLPFFDIRRN